MPAGTSLRFASNEAQVFVDDALQPYIEHLGLDLSCYPKACEIPVGEDMPGYTRPVTGYDGVTRTTDRWVATGIIITGLKDIPQNIKFVLPPMSFNGGPQETITLPFKLSSGDYAIALNGC